MIKFKIKASYTWRLEYQFGFFLHFDVLNKSKFFLKEIKTTPRFTYYLKVDDYTGSISICKFKKNKGKCNSTFCGDECLNLKTNPRKYLSDLIMCGMVDVFKNNKWIPQYKNKKNK